MDSKDFEATDLVLDEETGGGKSAQQPGRALEVADFDSRGTRIRAGLKARLGDDIFSS